jgi:hypothetical protein
MDPEEKHEEAGKLKRFAKKIRSFFFVITIEPMFLIQG